MCYTKALQSQTLQTVAGQFEPDLKITSDSSIPNIQAALPQLSVHLDPCREDLGCQRPPIHEQLRRHGLLVWWQLLVLNDTSQGDRRSCQLGRRTPEFARIFVRAVLLTTDESMLDVVNIFTQNAPLICFVHATFAQEDTLIDGKPTPHHQVSQYVVLQNRLIAPNSK